MQCGRDAVVGCGHGIFLSCWADLEQTHDIINDFLSAVDGRAFVCVCVWFGFFLEKLACLVLSPGHITARDTDLFRMLFDPNLMQMRSARLMKINRLNGPFAAAVSFYGTFLGKSFSFGIVFWWKGVIYGIVIPSCASILKEGAIRSYQIV